MNWLAEDYSVAHTILIYAIVITIGVITGKKNLEGVAD